MKITFLGTADGKPSAERYCSSTMIEVNGARYFIDAGAPLIDVLLRRGVDIASVKAIFATHTHNDHVDGILSIAALMSWHYRDYEIDIHLPEQRCIDAFKELLNACMGSLDEERVRFHPMTLSTPYRDENISLTPIPTQHLAQQGRPAFSYLLEAEGRRVLFSGDLSQRLSGDDFPAARVSGGLDLMVCEMAHFGVEHVEKYLPDLKAKKLLFNHVFPLTKLEGIAALDGKYGYPVKAVRDGDEIEV